MEPKKIQKKSQKIWIIKFFLYICIDGQGQGITRKNQKRKIMTNKEWKIENLRQNWGDLLLEKESLIKKIWDIEYKINSIKEKLLRYGISDENSNLDKGKADMDKSNYLDNCFACDNNTDVHEL